MKVLDFFLAHPVFIRDEFARAVGVRGSTVDSHLGRYLRSGRIGRVKRGVFFAAGPGETASKSPVDFLLLASRMAPDAVLSHHSALEAHGYAQSVYERFFFLTERKSKLVSFRGRAFVPVTPPTALRRKGLSFAFTTEVERQRLPCRVTALERTHVRASVSRPGGRRRPIDVRLLVDTGAVYTVLPERTWRTLRLTPERTAEFTLADGTTITRGVSECRFTVQGQSATSPVVLGGPEDAPLLGAVTLETLGLMVNPLTRELLPMRLMLAGASRSGHPWLDDARVRPPARRLGHPVTASFRWPHRGSAADSRRDPAGRVGVATHGVACGAARTVPGGRSDH